MTGVWVFVLVAIAAQLLFFSSLCSAYPLLSVGEGEAPSSFPFSSTWEGESPSPSPSPSPLPPTKEKVTVVVYGFVYCDTCKLPNDSSHLDASPLFGAAATLICNFTRPYQIVGGARQIDGLVTFMISETMEYPYASYYDMSKCKVFLAWSSSPLCRIPTNINGGISGVAPEFRFSKNNTRWGKKTEYYSFNILFFQPINSTSCPSRIV